ncbi:MAG: glutamate synthase subunit alpha, partial [Alphaproteobacteria bacterium]|nr:glutamate synthase subunit alpha [Alphaproteobacteria bacterium]
MSLSGLPERQGLYDASHEHDACGIGFVANIKNAASHEIVSQGLTVLDNLTHRGAAGADPLTGDGAGILIQLPDRLFRAECAELSIDLPALGAYGAGMTFLPQDQSARAKCEAVIEAIINQEGQTILGWRDLPVDNSVLSDAVREIEPFIRQVFVARGPNTPDTDQFERKLFVIRKQIHKAIRDGNLAGDEAFYMPSFSARTICFKGMML